LQGLSDHTFVSPVCLPWNSGDPGYSISPGEELTVTGWGSTTNSLEKVNEVKKLIHLNDQYDL